LIFPTFWAAKNYLVLNLMSIPNIILVIAWCFANDIDYEIISIHFMGILVKLAISYVGSYYLSYSLNPI